MSSHHKSECRLPGLRAAAPLALVKAHRSPETWGWALPEGCAQRGSAAGIRVGPAVVATVSCGSYQGQSIAENSESFATDFPVYRTKENEQIPCCSWQRSGAGRAAALCCAGVALPDSARSTPASIISCPPADSPLWQDCYIDIAWTIQDGPRAGRRHLYCWELVGSVACCQFIVWNQHWLAQRATCELPL